MTHSLVLSPHFDDAFASVFGLLSGPGERFTIAYPFCREVEGEVDRRWLDEERHNVLSVGAEVSFMGADSCGPPVFGWPPVELDSARVERLADTLEAVILRGAYATVIAPLGVGLHVDHLACCDALLRLLRRGSLAPSQVAFYSDIPYCLSPSLLRGRELQLQPARWLSPHVIAVKGRRKQLALDRYRSQFEPGVGSRIVARAARDAVTLKVPLAEADGQSWECVWSIAAPIEEVEAAFHRWPARSVVQLQADQLPFPGDDVSYFPDDIIDHRLAFAAHLPGSGSG